MGGERNMEISGKVLSEDFGKDAAIDFVKQVEGGCLVSCQIQEKGLLIQGLNVCSG
jgi:hypothetical protein